MQRITMAVLLGRIKHLRRLMKDPSTALWKKALVVFSVVYLVLPVDLIPPLIPVFGFLDDFALWCFVLYLLWDELGKYDAEEVPSKAEKKKKFRGKNVVNGVEFEVKIEEASFDGTSAAPGEQKRQE